MLFKKNFNKTTDMRLVDKKKAINFITNYLQTSGNIYFDTNSYNLFIWPVRKFKE